MSPALRSAVNSVLVQEYGAEPEDLAVSADEEDVAGQGSDFLLPDGYDRLLAHVRAASPSGPAPSSLTSRATPTA